VGTINIALCRERILSHTQGGCFSAGSALANAEFFPAASTPVKFPIRNDQRYLVLALVSSRES